MSRRINQIDQKILVLWFSFGGRPSQEREVEGDGGGLHSDAAQLFIWSGIKIANLASEFGRNDAICGDEGVREGSFAMVLYLF